VEAERLKKGVARGMSPRYRIFRRFMLALGWLLFGFTAVGAEKVPKAGPLIVAANHRRYADPVFVSMAVPRRIQWMAKKQLFVSPFDKFFFFIGAFPVDREKGGRAALRVALDLLAANWALGIFPEGTRRKAYDPEWPCSPPARAPRYSPSSWTACPTPSNASGAKNSTST
jgi:1-acyl-sn-glycerol-3-phosphate acyltransferase